MRATRRLVFALALTLLANACPAWGRVSDSAQDYFPALEVSGSYYEIGHKVGSTFRDRIQQASRLYEGLFKFVDEDGDKNLQACVRITTEHFPEIIEELRGIADGAQMPFERIFAMNMRAEVEALRAQAKEGNPGCSTIHLISGDNKYLLQNEDASSPYVGNMYVVKATTPKGITFVGLCYPGIALANGPAITSAGIMQTNNSISGYRYKKGIPRTIVNRAMLEAGSLDEAVKTATHPARANSYHHSIGWVKNQRLLSVEVIPDDYTVHEAKETYVHTNHMILDRTCKLPCDLGSLKKSSMPRYRTIIAGLAKHEGVELSVDLCLDALSSHAGKPYCPCRHPSEGTKGQTLATAVFDIRAGSMTLYRGNPCTSVPGGNCKTYAYDRLE